MEQIRRDFLRVDAFWDNFLNSQILTDCNTAYVKNEPIEIKCELLNEIDPLMDPNQLTYLNPSIIAIPFPIVSSYDIPSKPPYSCDICGSKSELFMKKYDNNIAPSVIEM